jgi:ATP/maltotriose-dependent transcriptional regulator MalT
MRKGIDQAKLVPVNPPYFLSRRRLVEAILGADRPRITLISTAPGYGKSALLAEVVRQSSTPTAFCRLDKGDRDIARFIRHLVTAIRQEAPDFAARLGSDPTRQIAGLWHGTEAIAGFLADELARLPKELSIILDDAHFVYDDEKVRSIISYLLDAATPSIRYVIASRGALRATTARLRAYRLIQELTNADLAFTSHEAAEFLARHELQLGADDVESVVNKTLGWAAGLVMMAHLLKTLPKRRISQTIERLNGSSEMLYDFLADEVFVHEQKPVQDFLVRTSILTTLRIEDCAALTRINAREVLESLERKGLFVTSVGADPPAFQYHPLFREFLQARLATTLSPRVIRRLHSLAAQSHRERQDWGEALRHSIAASDIGNALQIVERVGPDYLEAGLFETVLSWIDALPEESVARNPAVLAQRGRILHQQGDFEGALQTLNRAFEAFRRNGDAAGAAAVGCELGLLHTRIGTNEQGAQRLLAIVNEKLDPLLEADVLRALSANLREMGDTAMAATRCERAYQLARHEPPSITQERTLLRVARTLGVIYSVQGRIDEAIDVLEEVLRAVRWKEANEIEYAWSWSTLGSAYYCAGDFEKAVEALSTSESMTGPHIATRLEWIHLWRGCIYRDQGKFDLAEEQFGLIHGKTFADLAYLRLLQQDYDEALRLARRAHRVRNPGEVAIERARATATLAIALAHKTFYEAANDYFAQAEKVLTKWDSIQRLLSLRLQRAAIELDRGHVDIATSILQDALPRARQHGYLHFFWWNPNVIARLCAHALETGIEVGYVRDLASRRLGPEQASYFQHLLTSEDDLVRDRALSILQDVGRESDVRHIAAEQILQDCDNVVIRDNIASVMQSGVLTRGALEHLRKRYALTWKEIEVFALYYLSPSVKGIPSGVNLRRECAARLRVSENTMRAHVKNIRLKLDLPGETGSVALRDWLLQRRFLAA